MAGQSSFVCAEEDLFSLHASILFSFFFVCSFRGSGSPKEFSMFLHYYLTWISVVMILLLFVRSSMSLQFSSSLILQLVHIMSQILPSQKSLSSSFLLKFHHSFNKAHNFGGPCLPFLCTVWKFYRNPIKPRFICAMISTSLTEVS
jgi:hypothetical protein